MVLRIPNSNDNANSSHVFELFLLKSRDSGTKFGNILMVGVRAKVALGREFIINMCLVPLLEKYSGLV